jgi:serine/threonine-protein kinase
MSSESSEKSRKPTPAGIIRLDTVLAVRPGAEPTRRQLRPEELALLDLLDGKRTVGEVLRGSRLSGFVAMRLFRSLYERDLLVAVGSRPAPGAAADGKGGMTQDLTGAIEALAARARSVDVAEAGASRPTAPGMTPPEGQGQGRGQGQDKEATQPLPRFMQVAAAAPAPAEPAPPQPEPAAPQPVPATPSAPITRRRVAEPTVPLTALSDAAAVPIARPPEESTATTRPFRLGPYEVFTRIAQGGMGSIYLCRRVGPWGFQRLFTLKTVRQHVTMADEAIRSFLRESRIGALVTHPNVQPVLDVGDYDGQPYLLLDYIEGASLADLMGEGEAVPPAIAVTIVLDALRGLQGVHVQADEHGEPLGVVHCDVSPQNLIVGLDGATRVTDFGSARLSGEPPTADARGTPIGKPAYMAPEQLTGEPVDARTDVFSTGVVLWSALTGQRLFAAATYEETAMNVMRKRVPSPSELGVPPALDAVVHKALAREREGRFATAEQMRAELTRVAVAAGLVASAAEVGTWVQRALGNVLIQRRRNALLAPRPEAEASPRAPAADEPVQQKRATVQLDRDDGDERGDTVQSASARGLAIVFGVALAAVLLWSAAGAVKAWFTHGSRPAPAATSPR